MNGKLPLSDGVFLSLNTSRLSRHHAAVILPLSGVFIELLIPFNDLTFGTPKAIAIEDRAAAYAHMPRHDLFPFALT